MSGSPGLIPTERVLPVVDDQVIETLSDSHRLDPDAERREFSTTVEEDQHFAHQLVIEGNRRFGEDIRRKSAFIAGASFTREALRRTLTIQRSAEITTDPQPDAVEGDAVKVHDVAVRKRRFGIRSIATTIFAISLLKPSLNGDGDV